MPKSLGPTPLISSYVHRLAKLIAGPVLRNESAVFLWPAGNARSLHLPAAIKLLSSSYPAIQIIYCDFEDEFIDTATEFKKFLLKLPPKSKSIRELFLTKQQKGKVLLIVNRLDVCPIDDQTQTISLIKKVLALNHESIFVSIHAGTRPDKTCPPFHYGQIPRLRHQIPVPLPTKNEAIKIITSLGKNIFPGFSQKTAQKIYPVCGSHIVLIRSFFRNAIDNPKILGSPFLVVAAPSFQLKLASLLERVPESIKKDLVKKIPPAVDTVAEPPTFLNSREQKIYTNLIKNKTVTRDEIAQIIWGEKAFDLYSDYAIDKTMSRLRQKLVQNGFDPEMIKTLKTKGYEYVC